MRPVVPRPRAARRRGTRQRYGRPRLAIPTGFQVAVNAPGPRPGGLRRGYPDLCDRPYRGLRPSLSSGVMPIRQRLSLTDGSDFETGRAGLPVSRQVGAV